MQPFSAPKAALCLPGILASGSVDFAAFASPPGGGVFVKINNTILEMRAGTIYTNYVETAAPTAVEVSFRRKGQAGGGERRRTGADRRFPVSVRRWTVRFFSARYENRRFFAEIPFFFNAKLIRLRFICQTAAGCRSDDTSIQAAKGYLGGPSTHLFMESDTKVVWKNVNGHGICFVLSAEFCVSRKKELSFRQKCCTIYTSEIGSDLWLNGLVFPKRCVWGLQDSCPLFAFYRANPGSTRSILFIAWACLRRAGCTFHPN